ncbi:MAG: S4 domain-containing protein, partial [Syntrophorhabdaceae bacterium]|nr:S4 domain-containing protein [Syntrophorhabdaceae bacterium]
MVRDGSTPGTFCLTVPPSQAGERLDRYLPVAFPGLSRAAVQRLIREGNVILSGAIPRPSQKLSGGEEISV